MRENYPDVLLEKAVFLHFLVSLKLFCSMISESLTKVSLGVKGFSESQAGSYHPKRSGRKSVSGKDSDVHA